MAAHPKLTFGVQAVSPVCSMSRTLQPLLSVARSPRGRESTCQTALAWRACEMEWDARGRHAREATALLEIVPRLTDAGGDGRSDVSTAGHQPHTMNGAFRTPSYY
eukprot:1980652-Pleurochrysis_carterae.AAC.1